MDRALDTYLSKEDIDGQEEHEKMFSATNY